MRALPGKLLRTLSDATVGTAIVMVHLLLAERDRQRSAVNRHARSSAEHELTNAQTL